MRNESDRKYNMAVSIFFSPLADKSERDRMAHFFMRACVRKVEDLACMTEYLRTEGNSSSLKLHQQLLKQEIPCEL